MLINHENLSTLTNDLGEETVATLMSSFIKETSEIVVQLADDQSLDDQALIATAHKLAGSTAMFGTDHLCNTLRSMEGLGKSGDIDGMRALRSEPRRIWEETLVALRNEVPELIES